MKQNILKYDENENKNNDKPTVNKNKLNIEIKGKECINLS